jgi:hypothetical protein
MTRTGAYASATCTVRVRAAAASLGKKPVPRGPAPWLTSKLMSLGTLRCAIRQRMTDWIVGILVKEHRGYRQRFPNDLEALRAVLRPGDVILVEGSQRISEVIKYLTQSSWSHAALYVGDGVVKRGGQLAHSAYEQFGEEADSLLVEATVEHGVGPAPLSKYIDHNLRICRPVRLRPGDLQTVLDTVITQIGIPYNVEHILDLLRYFFPIALLRRWRSQALRHSGKLTKEVICSSQIAMAFQRVRYPVQPKVARKGNSRGRARPAPGWLLGLRRRDRDSLLDSGVFTATDPSLVTPRDFDLSPYFQVVKPLASDRGEFDYKKIRWTPESEGRASVSVDAPAPRGADVQLPVPAFRTATKNFG